MTIVRMTATFGGLDNATLELKEGLNLLELPNEGGKSTWCAFLRAMLYGLESRKGGAGSEKNRYTPWSGAAMRGEMDVLWRGDAITLRRFPKGASPFGGFQAVYTGTAQAVPGLTADNVGELLAGCGKEVFQRTCFISQGGLRVDRSGDLERRVASLAHAGEEDVSFSEAERRLRGWRNARQSNQTTGSLPKLRAQADALSRREAQEAQLRQQLDRDQARLEQLERERQALEADLARHRAAQQQAQRLRYQQAAQELQQAQERLAHCQTAWEQAAAKVDRAVGSPPALLGPKCWIPLAGGGVLAALLLTWGLLFAPWPLLFCVLAAAAVLLGGGATGYLLRRDRQRQAAQDQRLRRLAQDRQAADDVRKEAQWALDAAQKVFDAADPQADPLPASPPPEPPQRPLEEDRRRLDQVRRDLALHAQSRDRCQGQLLALGDPSRLQEDARDLRGEIARQEEQLAALNLALEVLGAANAQLQTRFSPALNTLAGELMGKLTGGRHSALTFTREFEAMAMAQGAPRAAQFLSQGTADQAYLALRLAICLLTLPPEEGAPLVLDDALAAFDDARLRLALEVLRDQARTRQVLLFTCQSRERLAIAGQ